MSTIVPVILSGGSGSRLWPVSRASYPKQLLPMVGDQTMIQQTAARIDALKATTAKLIVVCNESHRFMVAEQLQAMRLEADILLEPEGRNTAPAVALAAAFSRDRGDNGHLLVMPADHVIQNVPAFASAVERGFEAAESGKLVTFGIVPTEPHTGYGYIQAAVDGDAPVPVTAFREKPDADTAQRYIDSGQFLWNSGMFLLPTDAYLSELGAFEPDMVAAAEASVAAGVADLDFFRPDAEAFRASPSNSIDYAVMERTERAAVVPMDAGWSDVGSWSSLQDALPRDAANNAITGDAILADCRDSLVRAESRLVAAVGLEGYVVVETKDSVLVAPKQRSEDVKRIVDQLKADERSEVSQHRQVFRPWGSYDCVDQGDNFRVKRLIIKPGAELSLQKHDSRAEHWIVVRGKARITRGDEQFDLGTNESTFIPIGQKHRIANPFEAPVHIIEVQCGDYLGEDDIVRFEDNYGREDSSH